MSNLKVINKDGQLVTDSREVAEMVGKRHGDLLESIRGYIKHLTNGKFRSLDFFIESEYVDSKGENQPCYLLTRKGCDMVANKMTGEKGVLFTAAYVTKFEEMERATRNQFDTSQLSPETQLLLKLSQSIANNEIEQKKLQQAVIETKEEVQAIREVVEIRPSESWRNETNKLIKKICYKLNDYKTPKDNVYKALQERGACDLKRRLENMRARLLLNGGSKTKADNLNYLDVIAEDKKLIEIYTAIVKEMAIKHKVA